MGALLENKSILITGGSTGIGRATALACAAEGARLTIADVNDAAGREVVEAITADGGEAAATIEKTRAARRRRDV